MLADGDIFKIATTETGIYKLSYDFLSDLGVAVEDIDPRHIQLYENGGKPLKEVLATGNRIDDLMENSIWASGENDGSFDSGDFILFYAMGTKYWNYDASKDQYFHSSNPYSDQSHYFIKIGNSNGKRITTQPSLSGTAYTSSSYDALQHYETEQVNLMEENFSLPASGGGVGSVSLFR